MMITTFRERRETPWFDEWTSLLDGEPLGYAAGDANLYRYVGNGVTNEVDPWGLYWPGYPYSPHPINWGTPYGEDPAVKWSEEHPKAGAIIGVGIVGAAAVCVAAPFVMGGGGVAAIGVVGGDSAALAGPGVAASCSKLGEIQQLINGIGFQIGAGGIGGEKGRQIIQQLEEEIGRIIGIN